MLAPSRWHINGYTWDPNGPLASLDRKIILTDTRQLANREKDRDNTDKHCIGRHPGIIDEQLCSGTGMYLLQSTWEAVERETKLEPKLVIIDFCTANRHRSVAKGTIMSCMLVEKGIEHGLLHLNGMNNWKYLWRRGRRTRHSQEGIPAPFAQR